jgi:chromate transporter
MTRDPPSLPAMLAYFATLGAVGFGGPAALADRMREDLVEHRRWLSAPEFELGLAVAAACPGPLAYQLAVFCGYVRHGMTGAFGVGFAFALAPFLLIVAIAAAYAHWSASVVVRGIFGGAGPVVVALIGRACWNLGRTTLHRAWPAWAICTSGFFLTWLTGSEPLWLFLVAAVLGASLLRPRELPSAAGAEVDPIPRATGRLLPALAAPVVSGVHAQLFGFFFKTGCLVFGSGLVIVPFLRSSVVDAYHWISPQEFLDSVTVGLVSPGPVVITATFVGYLVGRVGGAVAATIGMFLPAILFTIVATPWFTRYRHSRVLTGLVRGVTAAVVGVLAGTLPLVAAAAVPDVATAVILVAGVPLVLRRTLSDPVLVALGAAAGTVFVLSSP